MVTQENWHSRLKHFVQKELVIGMVKSVSVHIEDPKITEITAGDPPAQPPKSPRAPSSSVSSRVEAASLLANLACVHHASRW